VKYVLSCGRALGIAAILMSLCIDSASGAWNSAQTWLVGDSLTPTGTRISVGRSNVAGAGNILVGGSGGEFSIDHVSGGVGTTESFYTFCVERTEFILFSNPETVRVSSISQTSLETNYALNVKTSILYREFLRNRGTGTLFSGVYAQSYSSTSDADLVQNAIWHYQGNQVAANSLVTKVDAFYANVYLSLSAAMQSSLYGGVSILNLARDGSGIRPQGGYDSNDRRQDMLVYRQSSSPVIPEPASAVLFFSGLVGCCGFLRRRVAT